MRAGVWRKPGSSPDREDRSAAGRSGAVSARRSHLNDALAWSAARWTVDQAIAAGASVIYLEDLRSLEARGMGKTLSTRISQSVRGKIANRIPYLGAKEGIAVVTVPPRGTSRNCPACLTVLRHRKAPDRLAEAGWKWASCPGCRWQGDRDTGAWMRITARGLAHQNKTTVDRKAGTMAVRTVDEALEAHAVVTPYTCAGDWSKSGPTPRRKKKTTRPVPRRRGIPSRPGRPARPARPASVRRGAPERSGPRCPAQRPGTTTRPRSAPIPPDAPTGHAGRHSAPGSTAAPTLPRRTGRPPAGHSRPLRIPKLIRDAEAQGSARQSPGAARLG